MQNNMKKLHSDTKWWLVKIHIVVPLSGTVEGANSSASVLPPKSQQSYSGNILLPRGNDVSNHEKICSCKWIFEQENHTKSVRKRKINKKMCLLYI
jgi:hypothetical protein